MDSRYLGTHYLSGCQWFGAYVSNQSLECIQISFAFDLCDLTLSRKRMASSEPAHRPSKEPFQESVYWTDTSNQSLHRSDPRTTGGKKTSSTDVEKGDKNVDSATAVVAPTTTKPTSSTTEPTTPAVTIEPNVPDEMQNEVPVLPPYMRPTAVIVTCRTPRLTDSGMAEFIQTSSPDVSLSQADRDFEEDIAPSMEVIREIEQEEAEKERQLILDSQTRREIEIEHQNQSRSAQRQLTNDIRESMAAGAALEMETEIQQRGFYESPRQNRRPALGSSKS